jgi:hypothetical protein
MSTDQRRIRTSIPEEDGKKALPVLLIRIHELEVQAEQQQNMQIQAQQVIRDLTDDNQRLRELLSKAFVSLETEPDREDAGRLDSKVQRLEKKLLEALDSKESIEAVAEEGAFMLERALLRVEKENGRRKTAEDRALRLSHQVKELQSDLGSLQITVESLTELSKRGGGHEESEETRREIAALQVCVCVWVCGCGCVCVCVCVCVCMLVQLPVTQTPLQLTHLTHFPAAMVARWKTRTYTHTRVCV